MQLRELYNPKMGRMRVAGLMSGSGTSRPFEKDRRLGYIS